MAELFVGLFTARTQLARRPVLGGWSLSGVAMSGVFVTCGVAHLVAGVLTAFLLYLGLFFAPVQQLSEVFDGYQ